MQPFDNQEGTKLKNYVNIPADGKVALQHENASTAYIEFENNNDSTDSSRIQHIDNDTYYDDYMWHKSGANRNALYLMSRDEGRNEGDDNDDIVIVRGGKTMIDSRFLYLLRIGLPASIFIQSTGGTRTGITDNGLTDIISYIEIQGRRYGTMYSRMRLQTTMRGEVTLDTTFGGFDSLSAVWKSYDGIITTPRQSAVSAYRSNSSQTIPYINGATTAVVQFDATRFDIQSEFDTGTYSFSASRDGIYHYDVYVNFGSDTSLTGLRMRLRNNSSVVRDYHVPDASSTTLNMTAMMSGIIQLTSGDTIDVEMYITSSVAGNGYVNITPYSWFDIHKLS